MVILGIDPGYDRMGCAVVEKRRGKNALLYSDCFITQKKSHVNERMFTAAKEIEKVIKTFKPDVLAIEQIFFSKNQKTALRIAETRGMILYVAALNNISICELTPLQIKIALTGYGRAEKQQVKNMVIKILEADKPLRLNRRKSAAGAAKYDDEIDAIACAIACPNRLSTVLT